ncbi:MAG TPA: hypothetical protein PL182_05330 [Pseudobdellovibrionaceae bacterium]|nr:hypothetical protein [Pseudobdellovibrionaceae bacterium]
MTKKAFVICAALIGFTSVGAAEIAADPLTVYTEENALQLQAEYQEDLALMTEIQQRRRGDRDHRPGNRGHVRRRPPHSRPIPIPIPIPYRYYTCFARNSRGQLFSATANGRALAQRRAMQRCDRASAVCRPAGCRVY